MENNRKSGMAFNSPRNFISRLYRNIFDFVIPLQCACCEKTIPSEAGFVCHDCYCKLTRVPQSLRKSEYLKKFSVEGTVDSFWSAYIFERDTEIQKIVHQFKYNKKFLIAKSMGEMVGNLFMEEHAAADFDLIIPVPLHYRKKIQRGYNQSDYIARGVSKVTGVRVLFSAMKRVKNTKTQTGLHLSDRKDNMKDAFFVKNPENMENKRILLLDDVITTGATISECAKMLKIAGAGKVHAISLALAE